MSQFLHQVAKVLEFQLKHQSFQWIFRSDSFRIDWFDLLAVQGTLKSLVQHQNSKASILWCSAFFMVQLSHPYMTTRKPIALTRWTFVSQVMSLLFNMLSRLVKQYLLVRLFATELNYSKNKLSQPRKFLAYLCIVSLKCFHKILLANFLSELLVSPLN